MDKLTTILEQLKQLRVDANTEKLKRDVSRDLEILMDEKECTDWFVRLMADKYEIDDETLKNKTIEDLRTALIAKLSNNELEQINSFLREE